MYSLCGGLLTYGFPGGPTSVVVVPRPRPKIGDFSHAGMSVFHLCRRHASELFGSPVVSMLVVDSLAMWCAPRGVAKNARTRTPAIAHRLSLLRNEPGRSKPRAVSMVARVISPSMLAVATRAAAKSAISIASSRRRPLSSHRHSEAVAAMAKNIAAVSGWANVPYARWVLVKVTSW